ncbi:hypothetical protein E2C01_099544 [Portunus trituberculatus]|uniref:Uncharacterized protein n=1 Tax=Portunus trituberculatus TaxID=210409 RepID=A0A5B7KAP3_PORTR|nr:hypothetical protein [Portunus trituberculatus]
MRYFRVCSTHERSSRGTTIITSQWDSQTTKVTWRHSTKDLLHGRNVYNTEHPQRLKQLGFNLASPLLPPPPCFATTTTTTTTPALLPLRLLCHIERGTIPFSFVSIFFVEGVPAVTQTRQLLRYDR